MADTTQLVVLGAGPGGYAAAFYAADLGMQVALVDEEKNPGGVCLYRGCIPSKALLHVAKVIDEAKHAGNWGVAFSEPTVDVKLSDLTKLEGGMRAEMKGEVSARLIETASGASVWSRSTEARRQIGGVRVSAEQGVSGGMRSSNPREAMLPSLVYQLTHDFRPTTQRQPVR